MMSSSVAPRRGARVELAFSVMVIACVLSTSCCNGQNASGAYVDVTQTVTAQVPGRFGTQPSARSGQSMVRVDANTAVLFGGLTAAGPANDVWEYKLDTGNWTRLHAGGATPADAPAATVPPPRVGHSTVVLQGDLWAPDPVGTKFVVFGGNMRNDMWEFDTAAGKWRVLMTEVATSAAGWTRGAGATIAALAMACATLAMV